MFSLDILVVVFWEDLVFPEIWQAFGLSDCSLTDFLALWWKMCPLAILAKIQHVIVSWMSLQPHFWWIVENKHLAHRDTSPCFEFPVNIVSFSCKLIFECICIYLEYAKRIPTAQVIEHLYFMNITSTLISQKIGSWHSTSLWCALLKCFIKPTILAKLSVWVMNYFFYAL